MNDDVNAELAAIGACFVEGLGAVKQSALNAGDMRAALARSFARRAATEARPTSKLVFSDAAKILAPRTRKLVVRPRLMTATGNFSMLAASVTIDKGAGTPQVQARFEWKGPFGGRSFLLVGAPIISADSLAEWTVNSVKWNAIERLSETADVTVTVGTAADAFTAATTNTIGIPASIFGSDTLRSKEYAHLFGGAGSVVMFDGNASLRVGVRNISASTAVEPIAIGIPVLVDRCGTGDLSGLFGSGTRHLDMGNASVQNGLIKLGAVWTDPDDQEESDVVLY